MTVRDVPSIADIYDRVKGYDMVLTGEAPLADALNNRIESARLDKLVYTPRGLVYREETADDTRDRRDLFLKIVRETDLSWKEALYLLENILDCWQETGALDAIYNHDTFKNRSGVDEVVEILEETESVFQLMENYEWDQYPDVAVIGEYQFKALDRNVLPPAGRFDSIPLISENTPHELDPFLIYPSANSLVESMLSEISRENATDVAIVMEPSSPYQYLVASALKAREIPFMSGHNLTEDLHFRTLFKLMRCALSHRRLKVGDVQPILRMTQAWISNRDNEKYMDDLREDILDDFRSLVSSLSSMTFETAIEEYRSMTELPEGYGEPMDVLEITLGGIGLLHERISRRNLNRLEFYLNSFDVQVNKEKHGVLLASPKSEAFVDRGIVFYVGMDASWTRHIPEKPWVNRDHHRLRNIQDFQVLLQNGQERYFLVQEKRFNEDVMPCFYFNVLFDEPFETFSDRPHRRMAGGEYPQFVPGETFETQSLETEEPEPVETISQSTLNKLVRCPREFLISKMVPDPENVYMKKGNIFHDYAEFYVNHPEVLNKASDDESLELMVEAIRPYLDDWQIAETRTEFRVGIENIREFMDERPPTPGNTKDYRQSGSDNLFADHFDRPIESPVTEAWFKNPDIGAHGKIDLIRSPKELVDYKSGGADSSSSIVRGSNVDLLEEDADPNFQAIMYLAQQRRVNPGKQLKFTFFHFLENMADRVRGQGLLSDTLVSVTYYPRTFAEQVPRDDTIEYLRTSNDRRKLLDKLGEDNFRQFFTDHPVNDALDKQRLLKSELADEFLTYSRGNIGDHSYVTKGCNSILKRLVKLRTENYFKEDLDRFEAFLREQIGALNEYRGSKFPVRGFLEDFDLDNLNRQDLILDDTSVSRT